MEAEKKGVDVVNMDTGEVLFEHAIIIPSRKRKYTGERFFMAFQDYMQIMAADKRLTGTDLRVMIHLLSVMDFENWVRVSQKSIAQACGVVQQKVSLSLKKLTECNYIDTAKMGSMNVYRINSNLAWKGKMATRCDKSNVIQFPK